MEPFGHWDVVCGAVCERKRERERERECVCVCVRERERERLCVRERVFARKLTVEPFGHWDVV